MKLTLDWNCIIEVEENRSQAQYVRELVIRHRDGQFEVALLAASASENLRSKRFPGSANAFTERVSALGWSDLPLVRMPGVQGLSFVNFSYLVGDGEKFKRDMDALWQAIAPRVPRNPCDHLPSGMEYCNGTLQSEELSKWRNTWCDVVSAYSHIQERRDIFVTNNTRDFQKNRDKLSALGMRIIATPAETVSLVNKHFLGDG